MSLDLFPVQLHEQDKRRLGEEFREKCAKLEGERIAAEVIDYQEDLDLAIHVLRQRNCIAVCGNVQMAGDTRSGVQ